MEKFSLTFVRHEIYLLHPYTGQVFIIHVFKFIVTKTFIQGIAMGICAKLLHFEPKSQTHIFQT